MHSEFKFEFDFKAQCSVANGPADGQNPAAIFVLFKSETENSTIELEIEINWRNGGLARGQVPSGNSISNGVDFNSMESK